MSEEKTPLKPPDWAALVPEVTMRHQQLTALDAIWKAFYVDNKRLVLLEAPTGVGKSIIQLALARYEYEAFKKWSYIVTPQRQLQDQMKAWEGLRVMKGRGAYQCNIIDGTAATAPCLKAPGVREANPLECSNTACPYYKALDQAVKNPIVVHNYASLMAQAHIGGHFSRRGLLCLDEGHTAAGWVRNYMTCEFSPSDMAALTTRQPPSFRTPNKFMPWIRAVLSEVLAYGIENIPQGMPDSLVPTLMKIANHHIEFGLDFDAVYDDRSLSYEEYAELRFSKTGTVPWETQFNEPSRWLPQGEWVTIPLKVASMTRMLTGLGDRVLIVSATLLSKALMCAELGEHPEDTEIVRIDSAFPSSARPIIKAFAGSMSFKKKGQTTPRLMERITDIAFSHREERGLIHTVSHSLAYDIAQHLKETFIGRPIEVLPRGPERDKVISMFLSGALGPACILIGPAMLEGLDGKYESCRWQVMAKAPWPSMMDPVVKFLMGTDDPKKRRWAESWYTWKAAQQTVQGIGRVCRAPDDFGVTYLLDSDFDRIMNTDFIPPYVTAAVRR